MKLSDARDSYYANTGTVSELCRKLSYSGIAVIWLVKTAKDTKLSSEYEAWWILIIAGYVMALTLDFLQYLFLATTWGLFNHIKHNEGVNLDDELEAPSFLNTGGLILFVGKVVCVVITTIFLLLALIKII